MRRSNLRIPAQVLDQIFPHKLSKLPASERVYSRLKQQILSRELKKGQSLFREEMEQIFNVSETIVNEAFSELKKEGLIVIRGAVGSFVS